MDTEQILKLWRDCGCADNDGNALKFARSIIDCVEHPDNLAVDKFAFAMKRKLALARGKGRQGWDDSDQCSVEALQRLLLGHLSKGDPIDVGNFAMMLFNRGAPTRSFLQKPPGSAGFSCDTEHQTVIMKFETCEQALDYYGLLNKV